VSKAPFLEAVVCGKNGKISTVPSLYACGMKGGSIFQLTKEDLIELPPGSQLFMLPGRSPHGYNPATKNISVLDKLDGVAAFLPPGYTVTYSPAYAERGKPRILPLFSYAAIASFNGKFYTSAVRVDKDIRHDSRFIDMDLVLKNIEAFRKIFPSNRLVRHLEDCALKNCCPNAQNFFLKRFEAPLPTSPSCNARCAGCISYQPVGRCPATQARIKFIPTPEEIGEIALFHIKNVKKAIVSFGQGCEGEPLLSAKVIEGAIRLIRRQTSAGTINMNTNGSKPEAIARLFDAGLDSIRVSMNSAREKYYTRYYKPSGYRFGDVLKSIGTAKKKNGAVSINYLTMPGFTDLKDEARALNRLIQTYGIDMVQWRNLNYDPLRYFKEVSLSPDAWEMIGVKEVMENLKKSFPGLKMGYFNRPIPRAAVSRRPRYRG